MTTTFKMPARKNLYLTATVLFYASLALFGLGMRPDQAKAASLAPVSIAAGPFSNAANSSLSNQVSVTTAGSSYLLMAVMATGSAGEQATSVAGGSLVWSKIAGGTAPNGITTVEFWGAVSPGALGGATMTVDFNNAADSVVSVVSLSNVNTANPVGVTIAPAVSSNNLTASFSGATARSMLFAAGFTAPYDFESVTAGANTRVVSNVNDVTQLIASSSAIDGGSLTISSSGYTAAPSVEYAGIEIMAASTPGNPVTVLAGPWSNAASTSLTDSITVDTAAASYIIVAITADSAFSGEQVSSVSGGSLAWTKLAGGTTPNPNDTSEFWGAASPGPLSATSITVTVNNAANIAITALALINVKISAPVGVTMGPGAIADNLSVAFSGTTADSMLFATAFSSPYASPALTAGPNTALYANQNTVTQFIGSAAAVAGGAQTISSTGYAAGSNMEYAAVEILSQVRGGSPKSPVIVAVPSIAIDIPPAGANYAAGSVVGLSWNPANGSFARYKVYYSFDGGTAWNALGETSTPSLSWTVPVAGTALGKIKVDGYDGSGNLLASATSGGNFSVINLTVQPPAPAVATPAPAVPAIADPTASGAYAPAAALDNNPDINVDLGLAAADRPACTSGTLIKGSLPSVYFCGADGRRHVFTTSRVYFSWYADFSSVLIIGDAQLAAIPLGENVTYRPGKLLVKAQSDPKIYAIARGGLLRWVPTADKAKELYGADWERRIDYIPDAFFFDYKIGSAL